MNRHANARFVRSRKRGAEPMSKRSLVPLFAFTMLAACGGGDDSGAVTGLQGPEQVTLVESSTGGTSPLRMPDGVLAVAGSDYMTDPTQFWIRDDSMRSLETVNMILQSLHQTHYYDQTNRGAYRALVEVDESGQGGESRGSQAATYEEWIVDSRRASNSAPQIVSFWVLSEDGGEEVTIYGRLTITSEPSDANPLGVFTLHFKGLPAAEAATSTATVFEGYLRSLARTDGQSEVEFYMSHGDPDGTVPSGQRAVRERVHALGDPSADTGRAYSEWKHVDNGPGGPFTSEGEYTLQFDADYVARRDLVNPADDVLDRHDFDSYVWRYGLYDATTEQRVDRLSGFPLEDAGGNHGWAGFHGIWFPESVSITNGQTLLRRSFATNSTTPYTAVVVPGRLEKRTRSAITLGDLVGEDLDYFDPSAGGESRVRYTGSDFVRVATRSGGEWTPVNPPVSIASSFTTGQWLNFWSQARGSVQFTWPSSLSNGVAVYVWSSTTITADSPELASGDMQLYGYNHMLKANITSNEANFQSSQSPYLPDATSPSSGNQTYVFDKETLMLTLGGNPVNLATGVTITQGPGMFGLNCGPLYATALASFAEFGTQTTTYEWMIGSNPWNQLRTLKDGTGAFVAFDPPLRFTYQHDETGSPYDGRTFFLEWDGSNLHGIPHEESSSGDGRWYPVLNIPTGTVLTDGTTNYLVKQLEGEQIMVAVGDPAAVIAARGFDLSTQLTAPTATPYEDPAIGTMPSLTSAPLYVGGILQTTDG
jgi:hypothetical protein